MLTTFESNSERVLCLTFSLHQPLILAGLVNGEIEMFDYREKMLIHSFHAHEGPVRGVDFHRTKKMFVSAGEDKQIHVWNYGTHSLIFTLHGHEGAVNTVMFMNPNIAPWILSASDDCSVRLWNWETQTCVYAWSIDFSPIKCASFVYDFLTDRRYGILTASMDDAICLWDIGHLDKEAVGPASDPLSGYRDLLGQSPRYIPVQLASILQGHHGTINWAALHPQLPLIFSGSSDHVHLWHMNGETNRYELEEPLVGHTDDVSCVVFHRSKPEIIVSASKDETIRIWDTTSRTQLHTFRTNGDRFWSLAAHPEESLLAAGHDSGLMVFKLERERPAFALSDDFVLFVKDNFLWSWEFSTRAESKVIPIRRSGILNQSPRTLSYSHKDRAALIFSDLDGGSYELYIIPEDSIGILRDAKRGTGRSAVFVAKSMFAVLEKSTNQVSVMDLNNEVVKTRTLPIPADAIFYAGIGILLCRSAVKVFLFDLRKNLVIGELETPNIVRYTVWSNDKERVALLSKNSIIIASKKLVHQFTLHETTHVKSGAWNDNGLFIYTTLIHLKCCFPNGKSGIVEHWKIPFYILKVHGDSILGLNRYGRFWDFYVDAAQYRSVLRRRFNMVDDGEEDEVRGLDTEGNGWATFDVEDIPSLLNHVEFPEWVQYPVDPR